MNNGVYEIDVKELYNNTSLANVDDESPEGEEVHAQEAAGDLASSPGGVAAGKMFFLARRSATAAQS